MSESSHATRGNPALIRLKRGGYAQVRGWQSEDLPRLVAYWEGLSPQTRKRFAPHAFDEVGVGAFFADDRHSAWLALDETGAAIIGYVAIRIGLPAHEAKRMEGYGMRLHAQQDASYAPSVADAWQGRGLGQAMFDTLVPALRAQGVLRLILWGGVQADNTAAIAFYERNGFVRTGSFEYQGWNYDMQKWLRHEASNPVQADIIP